MKVIIYALLFLFFSCNNRQVNKNKDSHSDTIIKSKFAKIELPTSKEERKKYYTNKDSVYIYSYSKDTSVYSKQEFNDIIDNFPELYSSSTINPDTAYAHSKIWVELIDSFGNKKDLSFNSEVGQDEYYILYAYFLKHRNGISKYSNRRKRLIEIYYILNSIFSRLHHGGTYFRHQYNRIEGYAEFSIYWFRHYENHFDRAYDISKQKTFYIGGLKQLITDELKNDEDENEEEIKEDKKKLFAEVDNLNNLIADNFYLRMAQSFQSDYY